MNRLSLLLLFLPLACGTSATQGTRADLASREFSGPEVLMTASEGRALVKKAKPLKEKAYLYVETWPPETEIRVDGSLKGTGMAMVAEGRSRYRLVSFTAPGYQRVDGFVELAERQVVKLRVTLRHDAALTVLTEPPGAEVRFDGAFAGHTPTTLRELLPGPHALVLTMGGWSWGDTVDIEPNSTGLVSKDISAELIAGVTPLPTSAPPPPPEPPPAPAPAPVASSRMPGKPPLPTTAPATVPAPIPAPMPAPAVPSPARSKADCTAVCERYANAVSGTDSFRDILRDKCHARCEAGDLAFSVCAWKARTMDDVAACAALPEPGR